MTRGACRRGAMLAGVVAGLVAVTTVRADVRGSRAGEALAICLGTDDLPGDKVDRLPALERGTTLAEAAIAADPRDVRAHVALVCNLGKVLEIAGLSWRSLQRVNRFKDAIEAGLRVAPNDPDLLTSKGVMLRKLPALLGGDPREGEKYLRRAIAICPEHAQAHRFLAEALADQDPRAARAEAERALAAAQQANQARDVVAARELVAHLPR